MENEEAKVTRCDIRLEKHCGQQSRCQECGWWPEEIERRRSLPLVKGEDGLFHKVVRKEAGNSGTDWQ